MATDWEKVDEMTLALLHLTTFQTAAGTARGRDTRGRRSIAFTRGGGSRIPRPKRSRSFYPTKGEERSRLLFAKHFGVVEEKPTKRPRR